MKGLRAPPPTRLVCLLIALAGSLPLLAVSLAYCNSVTTLLSASFLSALIFSAGSLWYFGHVDRAFSEIYQVCSRMRAEDLSARLYPPRLRRLTPLYRMINSTASFLQKQFGRLSHTSAEQDAILRTMVEGVVSIDPDGRIRTVNTAARMLLDISTSQIEGRLVAEVIRHAQLLRFVSEVLSDNAPRALTIALQGEMTRQLEVQASPLIAEGAVKPGILLVIHDTTRVRRLENVRRDFVANVSHELRTPITSIKGFVETLQDGAMHDPALLAKFLGIIGRQAERLNSIFNDLLTLAKLEAGGDDAEVELESMKVSELIRAAIDDCGHSASAKEIILQVASGSDGRVLVNLSLVEQALVNLIDNAIKYSEPKSVVRVEVTPGDEYTEVAVVDNGPGIEKRHLARLFERFYRVDQGRSRQQGGTGLGLAIVKHIAQVHGGRVEVKSVLGEGSRFSIFLKSVV